MAHMGGVLKWDYPQIIQLLDWDFPMKSTIQLLGYSHLQYENLHN